MRKWAIDRVSAARITACSVVVILDPDRWIEIGDLADYGPVVESETWFDLRKLWENQVRGKDNSDEPFLILVRDVAAPRELPHDIQQRSTVVPLKLPISEGLENLVRAVPGEIGDRIVSSILSPGPDDLELILSEVWGIDLPLSGSSPELEIEGMVRLRSNPETPTALWELIRPRLSHPLSKDLASDPPDYSGLQSVWEDWCQRGEESPWNELLAFIGPSLSPLFTLGKLIAVPEYIDNLPGWASAGVRNRSPKERAATLLELAPVNWPSDLSGWSEIAWWWGELRTAMAEGSPTLGELVGRCWEWWDEADIHFREWLTQNLGSIMTSASPWPTTVARIGPFLARRVRDRLTRRILLIVLDGMGIAQWSLISKVSGLKTVASGGCLAMLPSLTVVSRQAIFSGLLPTEFAGTIRHTNAEERLWRELWQREMPGDTTIRTGYWRLVGQSGDEVPDFSDLTAAGVVVNAVDEMMHGSEVLGDSQFVASILIWVKHGFLRRLVEDATEKGFEVWITADHGNVEAQPIGRPTHEGLAVESAGTRVRWYGDPALRSQSDADGIAWDPPGLPSGLVYPIFPNGRSGYFSSGIRISHGGMSLDEVIVPLIRVEP